MNEADDRHQPFNFGKEVEEAPAWMQAVVQFRFSSSPCGGGFCLGQIPGIGTSTGFSRERHSMRRARGTPHKTSTGFSRQRHSIRCAFFCVLVTRAG